MKTLLAFSDIHGSLFDPTDLPTADIAVIAGDITPADRKHYGRTSTGLNNQADWMRQSFLPWVTRLPVSHVLFTWGNHDHIGAYPTLLPAWPSHIHCLSNEGMTVDGITFYAVPETPRFNNWAFNDDDTDAGLGQRWARVPSGTDVLISHGPPFGVCDTSEPDTPGFGSRTLSAWLQSDADNRPRVIICGHIHGSGGQTGMCGDTQVYNVSVLDEAYERIREPRRLVI